MRTYLKKVKAYSSARDEYEGALGVFLDANENALGSASQELYNRYPDPHHKALKAKWSALKSIEPDRIFFGNGSDEPIDLLIRLFCEPGVDYIITLPPTYGMYEVSAAINNVANKQVPLKADFSIDLTALKSTWDEHAKLIFLCSPNNPSGNLLDRETMLEILKTFPGMVVVDEAYIDFSSEPSWVDDVARFPNLVVLQTLSKAWGMAGIRVGVAMGDPYVISMLDRIKPPYNLSQANQRLALEALNNQEKKEAHVKTTLVERDRLNEALSDLDFVRKTVPSNANFLLVKFDRAREIFEYLIRERVIVRDRTSHLHCEGCLRITIGKPEENDRLLELLKGFQ